jgi:ribosome biogenesis GTPase
MSKSQLSKQQHRRIQAAQERYRTESELGGESGLVIARFGKQVLIEEENGDRRTTTLRRRAEDPVAGDQVVWTPQGEHGVIEALLPRRTVISRPNSQGALRPIAANIDRLLIVIAPQPLAQANLIDRYLVAASHAGIDTSLIVNKADLLPEAPSVVQLAETYSQLGVEVVTTGQLSDPGAETLMDMVATQTVALVGQSGVGKSSLIKRLLPDLEIRIGALSDAVGLGRHTTTAAALYHLPGGGRLIDSPGVREFHLSHLPKDAIVSGFVEFEPLLGLCRFRDCSHSHEVRCAVLEAHERGEISADRLASYRQIVASMSQ